jgi:hypothetical protein
MKDDGNSGVARTVRDVGHEVMTRVEQLPHVSGTTMTISLKEMDLLAVTGMVRGWLYCQRGIPCCRAAPRH